MSAVLAPPEVRAMRWWDVEAVAALEARLFPADAWRVESFWSELAQHGNRRYVVAEQDGAVAGYAGLAVAGDEADVLTVAVDPGRQGHGLGGVLLDALLAEAARHGCRDVLLEVRAGLEPAERLYASRGFVQVGRRRAYYADGTDAVVMRRREPPAAGAGTGERP